MFCYIPATTCIDPVGWDYMDLQHPSRPGFWELRGKLTCEGFLVGSLQPVQIMEMSTYASNNIYSHTDP